MIDEYTLDQSFEARLSRGGVVENLYCASCPGVSHSMYVREATAAEKRERNRNMVAWQANVQSYLAADGSEDAWKHRTLNLDGLLAAGRI
jgi:hypothetical protein